jgi:hypothetical protein
MNNLDLEDLSSHRDDRHASLYTILVYDTPTQAVIDDVFRTLKKVSTIRSSVKKKTINDRLYALVDELKKFQPKTPNLNHIIFVGNDLITMVPLEKSELCMLQKHHVKKYTFLHGESFALDFLGDVFGNFDFVDVVCLDKHAATHKKINAHKTLVVVDSQPCTNIAEVLDATGCPNGVLHGFSGLLKGRPKHKEWTVFSRKLSHDELLRQADLRNRLKDQADLGSALGMLENPATLDKLIFGKEIKTCVESYMVKTLYVHESKRETFQKMFQSDLLNFKIVYVHTIEHGDPGDRLLEVFGGAVGVKRY